MKARVTTSAPPLNGAAFEALYRRYHHPSNIHPDPLEKVLPYADRADREVAGLLAAGLAYGGVKTILASVDRVLAPMGASPRAWLLDQQPSALKRTYASFRHRWTSGEEVADLLWRVRELLLVHGRLGGLFRKGVGWGDTTVLAALEIWVGALRPAGPGRSSLLASPSGGSACKRLFMYMRWMLRKDAVDPGCWWFRGSPRLLIVPVDTHVHQAALELGLTTRRQADMKCALEITAGLRVLCPEDPVRYDFALAHLGIRREPERQAWMQALLGKSNIPRDPRPPTV